MSIKRPDLGPAGSGEIHADRPKPGQPTAPQPLAEPREPQRTAGGIEQPLGINPTGPAASGPGERLEEERRGDEPERRHADRRIKPFHYGGGSDESGGSTRH
ncbi:MAG: hypothetical protein Q8P41_23170 [Pseudomonadota bacterium]|nr:hypothetical protein [Pseudomonadota bacterium]